MRLTQTSAPCMTVIYLAATAAANIDNSQLINVGDDIIVTSGIMDSFIPTRTAFPGNGLDVLTTFSPGIVNVNQGEQQIEQGPDGVKTLINGDQTIIDGPKGRTVINGDQTIVQTKATSGGQTMRNTEEESTGGAALATGMPLAGAVMVAGGAMMLF